MPGYLVDEGGERTHVVLPVEEYERLKKATEHLVAVRGYVSEIMSVMNEEPARGYGYSATPEEPPVADEEVREESGDRNAGW
ncbi:Hypothetical Protein RradSPS_0517 [Rubrobacter radiotolerans]|uniref:Uncharacterized protein n=1 Tax=Rubrobacter radiotolerans TaxID=42256 RepID=A0A023X1A4_RUBRA|nr:hypothetical protein [Rubrobacter radiotolerans]AHY45800.1 Hypothetical Protein RradSPS_0517 [Rubrobacter radiotolerans]MDX5893214.1 hypothetical protein [Rubrobacter radiotolerans]SMC03288.1 hypothetical protein SAMN00767673_0517 [Rubrobacter radiotolerans DSM 5868]